MNIKSDIFKMRCDPGFAIKNITLLILVYTSINIITGPSGFECEQFIL